MNSHIFITSHRYSGSTLLAMALGMHPDVVTMGEFYWCYPLAADNPGYQCSCGLALKDCGFWQNVHERIESQSGAKVDFFNFDLRPRFARKGWMNRAYVPLRESAALEWVNRALLPMLPGRGKRLRELRQRHRIYFEGLFDATQTSCFVDSSKSLEYLRILPDLHQGSSIDIKVIRLRRTLEGVVASEKRRHVKFGDAELQSAAEGWMIQEELTDRVLAEFPSEGVLSVEYEAFCRQPEAQLERMFRFLGVDSQPVSTDLAGYRHHVVGSRSRFLRGFRGIRRDDRWRKELSPDELGSLRELQVARGVS